MTLGTPAGGSPKTLFATITGYNFDNPFVAASDALAFATDCPTLFELFVDEKTQFKTPPKVTFKNKVKTIEHHIQQLPQEILQGILTNFEFEDLNGKIIKRQFNTELYDRSKQIKQMWRNVTIPDSVRYFNIYSDTTPTPFDFTYEVDSSSEDLSIFRAIEPKIGLSSGDGTVPTEAAQQDGFNAYRRIVVDATHMGLVKSHSVFNWIRTMVRLPCILAGEWNIDGKMFDLESVGNWVGGMIPYKASRVKIGGQIEAGEVWGLAEMEGSNITRFHLTTNDDCNDIKVEFFVGNESVGKVEPKRSTGTECKPKTVLSCPIEYGTKEIALY
jgi:hypothetical protein